MALDVLKALVGKDRITAEDAIQVRAAIYPDLTVTADEAEAMFEVNDTAHSTCPEWKMLFIEALTDHVVRQMRPPGYVDAAVADWLCARILQDGRVKSDTELELLIHVLEQAFEAPAALSHMALRQVAAFALTPERTGGEGPTLTGPEVDRLRRVLYAFAGEGGGAAVSRDEASLLFALNDAARGRPNDPAWRELFVHAIGAALLAPAGYRPPNRTEALRRQAWIEAPAEGVGALLAKTFSAALTDPTAGLGLLGEPNPIEDYNRDVEDSIVRAAPLTGEEGAWLAGRIGRDGTLDENEIALLLFVDREASQVHPDLAPLIARAKRLDGPGQVTFGRRVTGV